VGKKFSIVKMWSKVLFGNKKDPFHRSEKSLETLIINVLRTEAHDVHL
jgi:hypothetical protein